jgi:hypothetical protein
MGTLVAAWAREEREVHQVWWGKVLTTVVEEILGDQVVVKLALQAFGWDMQHELRGSERAWGGEEVVVVAFRRSGGR